MSDYIKREDVINELIGIFDTFDLKTETGYTVIRELVRLKIKIMRIPTADVVEVKHAKWEFPIFTDDDDGLDPRVKCSECGGIETAFARWNYCPNCGATMHLEE